MTNKEELLDKISAYIDTICNKKTEKLGFLIVIASEEENGLEFNQRTNMSSLLPDYYTSALGLKVAYGTAGNEDEQEPPKEIIQ